ncbi:WD40 repeat-like protein [Serendipita vermifera]|nr:WD40 repeat-like protein [Serendipita vermifera]
MWNIEAGEVVGGPWKGHTGSVCSLAFSSDAKHVVSGSSDRTIRLWNSDTGKIVGEPWNGHTDSVHCVAFSPNELYVVSGSSDHTIRLWNTNTATTIGVPWRDHDLSPIYSIAFSPDGQRIISGSGDGTIRLWSAKYRKVEHKWRIHTDSVTFLAFSPNGIHMISGSSDQKVGIWKIRNRQPTGVLHRGHTGLVNTAAFVPDEKRFLSCSLDNTIRMWNVESAEQVESQKVNSTKPIVSVIFSPDGKYVASYSNHRLRLWNIKTGDVTEPFSGGILAMTFTPEGKYLVMVAPSRVQVLRLDTGEITGSHFGFRCYWTDLVALSPDGKRIVLGRDNYTISLIDITSSKVVGEPWEGHTERIHSMAFSPNGKYVASGSSDDTVRLWSTETGKIIGVPWTEYDLSPIFSIAFSPDGQSIVSGSDDGTIRLWNAKYGKVEQKWTAHTNLVTFVTFSPDGAHVISGCGGYKIRAWDLVKRCFSGRIDINPTQMPFVDGSMTDNGWILGPEKEHILWIHPILQVGIYFTYDTSVFFPFSDTKFDFAPFAHGELWTLCRDQPYLGCGGSERAKPSPSFCSPLTSPPLSSPIPFDLSSEADFPSLPTHAKGTPSKDPEQQKRSRYPF